MKIVRIAFLAGSLAIASLGMTTSGVAAYGSADGPLAQIEFSYNCNNPDAELCQGPFGLGGVWVWIEIDQGGVGDIAGAGCGHLPGVGGGAGKILGDITWTYSTGTEGAFLVAGVDPTNTYYLVFAEGGPPVAFPVTVGHYSSHPDPGVAIELQVAP